MSPEIKAKNMAPERVVAKANLAQCCAEILEWSAKLYGYAGREALPLAESTTKHTALEFAVASLPVWS